VKPVSISIPSRTDRLHAVRDFVGEAAAKFGFDEESMNKIVIAVDEACTNIIKHAYGYATNRTIEITIVTNGSRFEVVIAHEGKSFDPAAIHPPDMKEYLSHFRHGGLGMHLMRSLMDLVEYRQASGKTSEVHLVKFLPAASGS
jgi:serine/threonine-protein kinase RsbW